MQILISSLQGVFEYSVDREGIDDQSSQVLQAGQRQLVLHHFENAAPLDPFLSQPLIPTHSLLGHFLVARPSLPLVDLTSVCVTKTELLVGKPKKGLLFTAVWESVEP